MTAENNPTHLTEDQGRILVRLARATIAARLGIADAVSKIIPENELAEPVFQEQRGTFVTLKISNQLRGCMGCLSPSETILEGIQRNAINAAFNDPRFPALTVPELEKTEIEVSILTNPRELAYSAGGDLLKKLRPNIDGVIIGKGMARATFLPQVWEQLPGNRGRSCPISAARQGFLPTSGRRVNWMFQFTRSSTSMKKAEIILKPEFARQVAELYQDMEAAYDQTAKAFDFSCSGCPDNCCDSYFLHHTFTEWAYLWHGLKSLDSNQLHDISQRAAEYLVESEAALVQGKRPLIMCPLNRDGLCALYPYRLMICRLHGIPATFTRPDGKNSSSRAVFAARKLSRPIIPLRRWTGRNSSGDWSNWN